jgi:hypothetical protein
MQGDCCGCGTPNVPVFWHKDTQLLRRHGLTPVPPSSWSQGFQTCTQLQTRIQSVKFQDILDTLFQDILDSFGVCKERVESGFWEYLGGG